MARNVRVLPIDSNSAEAEEEVRKLKDFKTVLFPVHAVAGLKEGMDATAQHPFDIVLVDPNVPGGDGAKTTAKLQTHVPEMPIVLFTNSMDRSAALDAAREGAQDRILKSRMSVRFLRHDVNIHTGRVAQEAVDGI